MLSIFLVWAKMQAISVFEIAIYFGLLTTQQDYKRVIQTKKGIKSS